MALQYHGPIYSPTEQPISNLAPNDLILTAVASPHKWFWEISIVTKTLIWSLEMAGTTGLHLLPAESLPNSGLATGIFTTRPKHRGPMPLMDGLQGWRSPILPGILSQI